MQHKKLKLDQKILLMSWKVIRISTQVVYSRRTLASGSLHSRDQHKVLPKYNWNGGARAAEAQFISSSLSLAEIFRSGCSRQMAQFPCRPRARNFSPTRQRIPTSFSKWLPEKKSKSNMVQVQVRKQSLTPFKNWLESSNPFLSLAFCEYVCYPPLKNLGPKV